MIASHTQLVVGEYRSHLEQILGQRLVKMLLFGSAARGEASAQSDIDLLCVVQEPFEYDEMIHLTSEVTSRISLEKDVVLSRVFVSEREYVTSKLPFFMNIRREGIQI